MIKHSATLAINDIMLRRRAAGERVLHMGFGEAGLPVLPELKEVLADAAGRNSYGPVLGDPQAREAVAGWFTRRGHPTQADQVILAPGSKSLLLALVMAFGGPVILPRPSWVSYAAQAELVGAGIRPVPIGPEFGGVPDPRLLTGSLSVAGEGRGPGCMVVTVPDNPTGTLADPGSLAQACELAREREVPVIADEIYADLVHDGSRAPSALDSYPERTVVTTGLSKCMALGGWRIGVARVPDNEWGAELMETLRGIASEVWSALAAPMQAVVEHVYSSPASVTDHIARSRRLHGAVAQAVWEEFSAAGADCRPPRAGFYLYPDFGPVRERLAARGIGSSLELADAFLEAHGIGFLPGVSFGDASEALTLRVATSLLYGADEEQRWESLYSEDPAALPWVQDALLHLRTGLAAVVG